MRNSDGATGFEPNRNTTNIDVYPKFEGEKIALWPGATSQGMSMVVAGSTTLNSSIH